MDAPSLLPELTRSLRALGSETGTGRLGEWQLAYFSPLLEARRRAVDCRSVAELVACFDAGRVERDIRRWTTAIAAEVAGPDEPLRRATEAMLDEAIEPLFAALQQFRQVAAEIAAADEEGHSPREVSGAMLDALTRIYRCTDDRWVPVRRVLTGGAP
jgi:hypothetical protein